MFGMISAISSQISGHLLGALAHPTIHVVVMCTPAGCPIGRVLVVLP
jgi:hypothetical protein